MLSFEPPVAYSRVNSITSLSVLEREYTVRQVDLFFKSVSLNVLLRSFGVDSDIGLYRLTSSRCD